MGHPVFYSYSMCNVVNKIIVEIYLVLCYQNQTYILLVWQLADSSIRPLTELLRRIVLGKWDMNSLKAFYLLN